MRRIPPWQSIRAYAALPESSNKKVAVAREVTIDGRSRLSQNWIPRVKGSNPDPTKDDAQTLLLKTGFLQQAYSGFFQLLPLGLRVQEKIERLIDRHMRNVGASKLSLSSISSEQIWRESGRLKGDTSELLRLDSRAQDTYLLAPTHEEEITKLVRNSISTRGDLPLRLYQISRKYRDERRPRQGLLRAREFLMKDLYTFDTDRTRALGTYDEVYMAYKKLFEELRIPFLVVEADSGSMGGNLSHEFHFPTPVGEDKVFSCSQCSYIATESKAESHRPIQWDGDREAQGQRVAFAITENRSRLVIVGYRPVVDDGQVFRMAGTNDLNMTRLKSIVGDVDPSVENPLKAWKDFNPDSSPKSKSIIQVTEKGLGSITDVDSRFPRSLKEYLHSVLKPSEVSSAIPLMDLNAWLHNSMDTVDIDDPLAKVEENELCPKCLEGKLGLQRVIELGHTFYLGTRYSQPLNATFTERPAFHQETLPVEMGCHGIGISRMVGAVAAILADEKGLNWPTVIAPYEAVIIKARGVTQSQSNSIYDSLVQPDFSINRVDAALDDRDGSFIEKLKDADLIGFPIIIVLGKRLAEEGLVEVQCRRLACQILVPPKDLSRKVAELLDQLGPRKESDFGI